MQIKNFKTLEVIYEIDLPTMRETLEAAVKAGANLSGANLYGAYLSGANLSGANLYGAYLSGANLYGANLYGANLYGANLSGANLSGAYLSGANLYGANLYGANLYGANLYGAYLSGANLSGAKNQNKFLSTSLFGLLEQPAKIRAYKLVKANGEGPMNGGLKYQVGRIARVKDACTDETVCCGPGVNVATLDWCLREWIEGYRILVVEFEKKDIAAIPIGSDGKFRLHRCKVVREIDLRKELDWPAIAEKKEGK